MKALDELLTQDPTAVRIKAGVPHPLFHFRINSTPLDEEFADILLDFIQKTTWEPDKNSNAYKHAIWFLLESKRAYFLVCEQAGIDAVKLRNHLKTCISHEAIDPVM